MKLNEKSTQLDANEDLIKILSDGQYHSGESLGEKLGISRAAIWKQLKKIEDLGLGIESSKGVGYRLEEPLDLLSLDTVLSELAVRDSITNFQLFSSLDSTNQYLLERTHTADFSGSVICAERQTAGKGRRGRVWESPFASNLYFSIGWTTNEGVASLEGLSLAIGVGITDALEGLGLSESQVKWPNDILHKGRKLAGVLIEVGGDLAGDCHFIVGVGLNVKMAKALGANINQPWVDLFSLAQEGYLPKTLPSRNTILATLLNHLLPIISNYSSTGLSPFIDRWQEKSWSQNKLVNVIGGSATSCGINMGISDTGALKVMVDGELRYFNGGEISLRVSDGGSAD